MMRIKDNKRKDSKLVLEYNSLFPKSGALIVRYWQDLHSEHQVVEVITERGHDKCSN